MHLFLYPDQPSEEKNKQMENSAESFHIILLPGHIFMKLLNYCTFMRRWQWRWWMREGLLSGMMTAGGCGSRLLWRRVRAHHIDSQWVLGRRVRGSDRAGGCGQRVRPPQPASQGFVRSHRTIQAFGRQRSD